MYRNGWDGWSFNSNINKRTKTNSKSFFSLIFYSRTSDCLWDGFIFQYEIGIVCIETAKQQFWNGVYVIWYEVEDTNEQIRWCWGSFILLLMFWHHQGTQQKNIGDYWRHKIRTDETLRIVFVFLSYLSGFFSLPSWFVIRLLRSPVTTQTIPQQRLIKKKLRRKNREETFRGIRTIINLFVFWILRFHNSIQFDFGLFSREWERRCGFLYSFVWWWWRIAISSTSSVVDWS